MTPAQSLRALRRRQKVEATRAAASPGGRYEFRIKIEMVVPIVAASAAAAAEVLNSISAETMLAVSERLEVEMEERK